MSARRSDPLALVGICLLAAQLAHAEPRPPCVDSVDRVAATERGGASISMRVNIQGEPFRGSAEAPIAIIEYGDYQCSFCGRFKQDVLPQIEAEYVEAATLKYIYRDLPLVSHQYALPAARAAYCAKEQGKFWEMHDRIYALKQSFSEADLAEQARALGLRMDDFQACAEDKRSKDEILRVAGNARMLQIEVTPTFLIGRVAAGGDRVDVSAIVVGAKAIADYKGALDPLIAGTCREAKSH
jgi:protein-disulfide isomerase